MYSALKSQKKCNGKDFFSKDIDFSLWDTEFLHLAGTLMEHFLEAIAPLRVTNSNNLF